MPVEELDIYHAIVGEFTEYDFEVGSRATPTTFQITGNRYDTFTVVEDGYGVQTLWSTGDGGFGTFVIGFIETDQDCIVELYDSASGIAVARPLKAKVPYYLHNSSMDAVAGDILTDGSESSLAREIERIKVQRNVADGEGDANVRLLLFE